MAHIHDFNKLKSAFAVFLCAIFFFLCVGLTLAGSSVYTNTVAASDVNFTERTALSYLVNQIHRGDRNEGISILSFQGQDAICIKEDFGNNTFVTLLYYYDGQLRELFMEEGTGLGLADGTPILSVSDFFIQSDQGIITLSVVSPVNNQSYFVSVSPRCGYREGGSL